MRTPLLRFSLALAALAVSACSTPEVKPDVKPQAAKPAAKVETPPPAAPETTPAAEFKAQGQAELDKALEQLKSVSVFFEFDSSTLTKDASDKLGVVGDVLSRHPELDVKIEGNCDERGSAQYNLALGQKRADVVKKYLAQLGVKAGQIKAISLGSEKPADPGHDEDAWKKNRRADVQSGPDSAKPASNGDATAAPAAPAPTK